MSLKQIETPHAPKALGPYSQAVKANSFIFVSGQLPIDPSTSKLIQGDIGTLTKQVLSHIENILIAAGSSLKDVVRVDIFLKDLNDFSALNEEYARVFCHSVKPARQTVQVAKLPLDSPIEISCIAFVTN
jgi:2-iminobutanoate/2-iminopropanoate deaminase